MVPTLTRARETDQVLLDSRRILTRSRALMTASRALIDQTFRHLESFSTSLDADSYCPVGKAIRILLVDDNPDILLALSNYLQQNGFAVEPAGDGIEALEKLEKNRFDLVLSDVRMPRMDGLTLAKAVRAAFCATPIILMTGSLPKRPDETAAQVGASHLITKFRLDQIVAKVEESAHRPWTER